MRRLVLTLAALAAVAGAAVPSFASTGPVTVTRNSNGTTVGVTEGQPIVGATVYNNGSVCFAISLEVPVCA